MKNKKGAIVFVIIVAVIMIIFTTMMVIVKLTGYSSQSRYEQKWAREKAVPKLYGTIDTELIGNMYEGNAKAGYQYYKVRIPIFNAGTEAQRCDYGVYFSIDGEEYGDVIEPAREYDDSYLTDQTTKIIPAGQAGYLEHIIQVKDGVTKIKFTYFEDSDAYFDDEKGETFEISL